jgi:hypothetical protein
MPKRKARQKRYVFKRINVTAFLKAAEKSGERGFACLAGTGKSLLGEI